ncbi:serine hydrolase [Sphingomonas sp. LY29]|uniref:serine hydrolase n=1 Tax=unclassified Sphingomonas TaxID=196159 RepID=UPI002ADEF2A5|nr:MULTISPECIES: serine hydrolase [unclassified Sphingomonas]MEA1071906.1 serine hydrolase [Sphingomonas sp. LY160]WRP25407.1 serine hydrolase [Sphingomonas sp. LY29]
MRFVTLLFWLLVAATPASAQSLPSLQAIRNQLSSMVSPYSADVGIAALDLKTGELISVHGDEPFPMASTVKVAVAANYLAQVEAGRRTLDDRIGSRSARSLIDAMLIRSDNNATDVLMADLGGPETLQRWLNQHALTGLRVDRNIDQLLRSKRDLRDVRDSSTPKAMVELLRRIDSGELLRPTSRAYLLDVMARCTTGKNRIRGLLPMGTRVEHKTGTLSGYASDVGFITMPDGRRIAVAMFARSTPDRPGIIARAARYIYDGFYSTVRSPLMPAYSAR